MPPSPSHQLIRIFKFIIVSSRKILVACNLAVCYTSYTFDENLHEHISHELAGDAGLEIFRDTS
jgi:hypothetical protein